ncbi:MAG: iron-sulfur cluster assembly scaffold protein [Pseudomonadota bacterium]
MASDGDLIKLYSQDILRLASDIPHLAPLERADGRSTKRAPTCGSVISVEIMLHCGKIAGFAQDVKACALGQAAASVVGHAIVGTDLDTLKRARAELIEMLLKDGPTPSPPFDGLAPLRAASSFANRHGSILLALDAAIDAFESAALSA